MKKVLSKVQKNYSGKKSTHFSKLLSQLLKITEGSARVTSIDAMKTGGMAYKL